MVVEICIGSSCHLKGSNVLVELFTERLKKDKIIDKVTLKGSFCKGKCNRDGVTVQVDDEIFDGVKVENFDDFYAKNIASKFV